MVDPRFPSMKAKALLRILRRDLGYTVARRKGSHQRLVSPDHPPFTWGFHDGRSLAPGEVSNVLCGDVGLDVDTALELL